MWFPPVYPQVLLNTITITYPKHSFNRHTQDLHFPIDDADISKSRRQLRYCSSFFFEIIDLTDLQLEHEREKVVRSIKKISPASHRIRAISVLMSLITSFFNLQVKLFCLFVCLFSLPSSHSKTGATYKKRKRN